MSRRLLTTVLMGLGALLCGGLAAYLAHEYIERTLDRERAALEAGYEPLDVLVAQDSLTAGDTLDAANVAVRDIPDRFAHASALRPDNWAMVEGSAVVEPVGAGESILLSHLAPDDGTFEVPEGKRAITIPVDRESAIAGFLQPGDRIDLLVTMRSPDDGQDFTVPLLESVQVIATDGRTIAPQAESGQEAQQPARTITIGVHPKQVAKITQARRVGNLTVSLRNDGDWQASGVRPITENQLARQLLEDTNGTGDPGSVVVIVGGGR